jgi:hypothetical protein
MMVDSRTNTGSIGFVGLPLPAGLTASDVVVTADGRLLEAGRLDQPDRTEVTFDPAFLEALTAGQTFHWGVIVPSTGARGSANFETAARPSATPYGPVTLITHGAELWPFDFSVALDNPTFRTPPEYTALAEMVARAAGGFLVEG